MGDAATWTQRDQTISWTGRFPTSGTITAKVEFDLPSGESQTLAVNAFGTKRRVQIVGRDGIETLELSNIRVKSGYQTLSLKGQSSTGGRFGPVRQILLDGPTGTHFNLKERRNAASVHLGYPVEGEVDAFYGEATPKTDPLWTYYEVCGFSRGYFGFQVNSPTERRIILSVWDVGNEAVDRAKVNKEDLVQLVGKGDNVVADSFGNEGTGGHSHLVYPWKLGQTLRFLVTAKAEGTHTTYTGYFYFPKTKSWGLIASFRAPKDGKYLRGLYAFNENFGGANGNLRRLCEFGNQWVRTTDGTWRELTTARFTHDVTGRADRLDYDAGARGNTFCLSNGGFLEGKVKLGDTFTRRGNGRPPKDLPL